MENFRWSLPDAGSPQLTSSVLTGNYLWGSMNPTGLHQPASFSRHKNTSTKVAHVVNICAIAIVEPPGVDVCNT